MLIDDDGEATQRTLTEHMLELATLRILVASLLAHVCDPDGKTTAAQAGETLKRIHQTSQMTLATATLDVAQFSQDTNQLRESLRLRVDEVFGGLKFSDDVRKHH